MISTRRYSTRNGTFGRGEAQPGINQMGGGTVLSAPVEIKPRRTAEKPVK
jgi:hypothetical protein